MLAKRMMVGCLAAIIVAGMTGTPASAATPAAAPSWDFDGNPAHGAGILQVTAPTSVKRGEAWDLTVTLTDFPTQGTGAGPTMILLTDYSGMNPVQILRPVSLAARTGTVVEKVAKKVRPGSYLIRVLFKDGWTKSESTSLTPITVTR